MTQVPRQATFARSMSGSEPSEACFRTLILSASGRTVPEKGKGVFVVSVQSGKT
jgi:hypothetical protein